MWAVTGSLLAVEPVRHFASHFKILGAYYEYPRTRVEANIFFKEVFRMPQFWSELGKKITYGTVTAGGDTALKLAMFQHIYGGTWSPQEYVDWNSWKHLICSLYAFIPTCYTGVPFENARRAYYADKTWPLELRRNYKSPLQALVRIPFEEGPAYLFRGGFPIAMSQFLFWTTYCTIYTFHKDKYFYLWQYQDFNYDWCKAINMGVSFFIASFVAYPAYYVREMVDLWPKERGGHCTWDNSYRKAFKWQIENMDMLYYNYLPGYWTWVKRYGALYLGALWLADNLGMMSNCNEAFNSLEVQFPLFVESS